MPEFFEAPINLPDPQQFLPAVRQNAHRRHIRNVMITACSAVIVTAALAVGVGLAATSTGSTGHDKVQFATTPTPTASPAPASSGRAHDIPITNALKRAVVQSFYAAYEADPKRAADFGFGGAATPSDLGDPWISHAGVVLGAHRSRDSYWIVAGICFKQYLNACMDAGSYQVFTRIGPSGPLRFLFFAPCEIPRVLADRWYPHGEFPMGTTCPNARHT